MPANFTYFSSNSCRIAVQRWCWIGSTKTIRLKQNKTWIYHSVVILVTSLWYLWHFTDPKSHFVDIEAPDPESCWASGSTQKHSAILATRGALRNSFVHLSASSSLFSITRLSLSNLSPDVSRFNLWLYVAIQPVYHTVQCKASVSVGKMSICCCSVPRTLMRCTRLLGTMGGLGHW